MVSDSVYRWSLILFTDRPWGQWRNGTASCKYGTSRPLNSWDCWGNGAWITQAVNQSDQAAAESISVAEYSALVWSVCLVCLFSLVDSLCFQFFALCSCGTGHFSSRLPISRMAQSESADHALWHYISQDTSKYRNMVSRSYHSSSAEENAFHHLSLSSVEVTPHSICF